MIQGVTKKILNKNHILKCYFFAFSFLNRSNVCANKKLIKHMVNTMHLKTLYNPLLHNTTKDVAMWYVLYDLYASDSTLPP